MLWRRKRRDTPAPDASAAIAAAVPLLFSPELFKQKMSAFVEMAAEDDGPEPYLLALAHKHERIAAAASTLGSRCLSLAELESLLEQIFTARRRLYPALAALGPERVSEALRDLVGGQRSPDARLQAFVDLMPGAQASDRESLRAVARVRRAAWDFAAEILHFYAPERYALMNRWVWDDGSQSGALRELAPGRDQAVESGLGGGVYVFEAACGFAGERLREAGVYRDIPFWIDLVFARAYIDYLGAATQGNLGADFVRGTSPREQLRKLLGIDRERALGRSRVRRATGEHH